ncbi:DUF3545 family protein [Alteromonadaceae bacterium M269]|nr:DUF3545 family protein [Alteromonadaceae bacterium M269]
MDKSDLMSSIDTKSNTTKSRSKKLRWREIEEIQDRHRLRKELEDFALFDDLELTSLDR